MSKTEDKILSQERIDYYKQTLNKNLNLSVMGLTPIDGISPSEAIYNLFDEFEQEFLITTNEYKKIKELPNLSEDEFWSMRSSIIKKYFQKFGITDLKERD